MKRQDVQAVFLIDVVSRITERLSLKGGYDPRKALRTIAMARTSALQSNRIAVRPSIAIPIGLKDDIQLILRRRNSE